MNFSQMKRKFYHRVYQFFQVDMIGLFFLAIQAIFVEIVQPLEFVLWLDRVHLLGYFCLHIPGLQF
jgi:hypothetical protein